MEEGSDRYRPKARGDRVMVSEGDAARLAADGAVELIDDSRAPGTEAEAIGGGAQDLEDMTIPELRHFANARRFNLGGARTRPEILASLQEQLNDEGGEN